MKEKDPDRVEVEKADEDQSTPRALLMQCIGYTMRRLERAVEQLKKEEENPFLVNRILDRYKAVVPRARLSRILELLDNKPSPMPGELKRVESMRHDELSENFQQLQDNFDYSIGVLEHLLQALIEPNITICGDEEEMSLKEICQMFGDVRNIAIDTIEKALPMLQSFLDQFDSYYSLLEESHPQMSWQIADHERESIGADELRDSLRRLRGKLRGYQKKVEELAGKIEGLKRASYVIYEKDIRNFY